ncbi:MAG: preprotein translocase subunit SecG [Myxococcales bacterium]|jgi:preprotein translocase subunit SecG|nr:preprotein translocase subunit SecG [Myxococcales bacterium]
MITLFTVIHVLVAIFLIIVILLQAGKDAGMGAAFGGGGSGSVFGGRGAGNLLSRTTAVIATIFFVTSFALSFAASYNPTVSGKLSKAATEQTAQPAAAATTTTATTTAPEAQNAAAEEVAPAAAAVADDSAPATP